MQGEARPLVLPPRGPPNQGVGVEVPPLVRVQPIAHHEAPHADPGREPDGRDRADIPASGTKEPKADETTNIARAVVYAFCNCNRHHVRAPTCPGSRASAWTERIRAAFLDESILLSGTSFGGTSFGEHVIDGGYPEMSVFSHEGAEGGWRMRRRRFSRRQVVAP